MVDPTKDNELTVETEVVVRRAWTKPLLETSPIDETEFNAGTGADGGAAPSSLS